MFVYFCIIREKELDKQVENMNTIVREPFNNFKKGEKRKHKNPSLTLKVPVYIQKYSWDILSIHKADIKIFF